MDSLGEKKKKGKSDLVVFGGDVYDPLGRHPSARFLQRERIERESLTRVLRAYAAAGMQTIGLPVTTGCEAASLRYACTFDSAQTMWNRCLPIPGGFPRVRCSLVTNHAVLLQSYLEIDDGTARFHGTLDIETLGGAGFASQRTTGERKWDFSDYAGIQLNVAKGDSQSSWVSAV